MQILAVELKPADVVVVVVDVATVEPAAVGALCHCNSGSSFPCFDFS